MNLSREIPTPSYSNSTSSTGTIDVITGPMYSAKTTELIKRLSIEAEMGFMVLYINHLVDEERSTNDFSTHNPVYKEKIDEVVNFHFKKTDDLMALIEGESLDKYDVIGIDEAQFFNELINPVLYLAEELNKHVIVAGLSLDSSRQKFIIMEG